MVAASAELDASCSIIDLRPPANFLPKAKSKVAPRVSHGSTRMKVWAGVFNSRNAPAKSADQARGQQWNHHAAGNVQPLAIGASAGRGRGPQRNRVRGIGGNRGHAREQQRRKRDEAAASRDGIEGSAKRSREKKKDNGSSVKELGVSETTAAPPMAQLPHNFSAHRDFRLPL